MAGISEILGETWKVECDGNTRDQRSSVGRADGRVSRCCQVTHGVSAAEPQGIASLRATPEGRRQRRSFAGSLTGVAGCLPFAGICKEGRRCTGIFPQSTTSWSRRGRTRQSFLEGPRQRPSSKRGGGSFWVFFMVFFLVFFMVFRSADARVSQSVKQLVGQLVDSRPSGQSVGEPTERSVSQSVSRSANRAASQSVSQSVGQRAAVSQSVSQSVVQRQR